MNQRSSPPHHPIKSPGFSLVELMVVLVIIGLLATVVVPSVLKKLSDGQWTKAKADIVTLHHAVNQFALQNNGRFPAELEELIEENESGHAYLEQRSLPTDPWGFGYHYEPPSGERSRPLISTWGKDGVLGGEGDDRDLSNIDIFDGDDDGSRR